MRGPCIVNWSFCSCRRATENRLGMAGLCKTLWATSDAYIYIYVYTHCWFSKTFAKTRCTQTSPDVCEGQKPLDPVFPPHTHTAFSTDTIELSSPVVRGPQYPGPPPKPSLFRHQELQCSHQRVREGVIKCCMGLPSPAMERHIAALSVREEEKQREEATLLPDRTYKEARKKLERS